MSTGLLVPFPRSLEAVCGRCSGRIVWAVTAANGRSIPLEWQPDESGNQAVARDQHGTPRTRQLGAGEDPEPHERRMLPHFPECERRRAERIGRDERLVGRSLPAASLPPGVVDLAAARRRRRMLGRPRRR